MKAQLSLEFYASIVIFILFATYVFFQLLGIEPQFMSSLNNERLKSEAYQVSEMLVNSPGNPADWPGKSVTSIGLSSNLNDSNLLSVQKISAFNSLCGSSYDNMRSIIDTEYQFSVTLTNISGGSSTLINCNSTTPMKTIRASVTRIVALDSGDVGELKVEMW